MEKYFEINEKGFSIRCKWYANNIRDIQSVILFCHGFGGHKDNNAAARFASTVLGKYKTCALMTFDWPAHGNDARNKLVLSDCDEYLTIIIEYLHSIHVESIYIYGNSFGGYLTLKYIQEHGNPFKKIALRSPAINMYQTLIESVLSEDDLKKIEKGKDALAGFDRKVKINKQYLEDVKNCDITTMDFIPFADELLIASGKEDEIVRFDVVEKFCDDNIIEFYPFEGVEHRFRNQNKLDECHSIFLKFYDIQK